MREQKELSQTELGAMVGMNQNAIHRLESPEYGRATITTLKRLAAAFDVALIVRFVPFSQLINWISGTPFVDNGLSSASLAVPSYDEEKESGVLSPLPVFPAHTITVPADANLLTVNVSAITHRGLLDQIIQKSTQGYISAPEPADLLTYLGNSGTASSQVALRQ
jgi:transcriptional regulator with XRE-family HTH domain